jgi:energy-coupling factor transporter ATP-binding protein EcfA2
VMIQAEADVLLIDEVLAVGDAAFQQKCFDVFYRMRDEGKTILFVTHDMASVQRFCHRALLIEHGEIRMIDEPERVANNYLELNFGREAGVAGDDPAEGERYGSQAAQIVDAWFEDEHGQRQTTLAQGRPCTFRARVAFRSSVEHPAVAVVLENEQHHPLFATSSEREQELTGVYEPGDEATFTVAFDNVFAPGRLHASPWVVRRGGTELLDRRPRVASLVVTGALRTGGSVDLPHDVSLERAGSSVGERTSA